jgi:hypothetical protein
MANTEYSGLELAVRINGVQYRCQRVRTHRHGETGDVTSGEDSSKRRIGTVPDWEVTLTKASFDPDNNLYSDNPATWDFRLFDVVDVLDIYPGGVAAGIFDTFTGGIIDDLDMDMDANMLEPFTCHIVCADGTDTTDDYASQ